MNKQKGVTLIETIIVISILGVIGVIFSGVLTQGLRGQNKVNVINQVKQNGQNVLNKVEKTLREADTIVCVGQLPPTSYQTNVCSGSTNYCGQTIVFKTRDGAYMRFRFSQPVIRQISPINGSISLDTFDTSAVLGSYRAAPIPQNASDALCTNFPSVSTQNLSDNSDPNKSISITAGGFTRKPSAGNKDSVTVIFRADNAIANDTTTGAENRIGDSGEYFSTTIQLR